MIPSASPAPPPAAPPRRPSCPDPGTSPRGCSSSSACPGGRPPGSAASSPAPPRAGRRVARPALSPVRLREVVHRRQRVRVVVPQDPPPASPAPARAVPPPRPSCPDPGTSSARLFIVVSVSGWSSPRIRRFEFGVFAGRAPHSSSFCPHIKEMWQSAF